MDDELQADQTAASPPSDPQSSASDGNAIEESIREALLQLAQLSDLVQPLEQAAETLTQAGKAPSEPSRSPGTPLPDAPADLSDMLRQVQGNQDGQSFFSLPSQPSEPNTGDSTSNQAMRDDLVDRSDSRGTTTMLERWEIPSSSTTLQRQTLLNRHDGQRVTGEQPEIADAWAALERSRGAGSADAIRPGGAAEPDAQQSPSGERKPAHNQVPRVPSLEGAQTQESESSASGGKSVKEQLADLRAEQQLLQRAVDRLKRAPARFA
jgi:hypothetical protein